LTCTDVLSSEARGQGLPTKVGTPNDESRKNRLRPGKTGRGGSRLSGGTGFGCDDLDGNRVNHRLWSGQVGTLTLGHGLAVPMNVATPLWKRNA
jgi:hypothetical protein